MRPCLKADKDKKQESFLSYYKSPDQKQPKQKRHMTVLYMSLLGAVLTTKLSQSN